MRMISVPILVILGVASGCTTITPEEQRAADEAKCRSYGFIRKNDSFAECMQRLDLDRRAERRSDSIVYRDPWLYY